MFIFTERDLSQSCGIKFYDRFRLLPAELRLNSEYSKRISLRVLAKGEKS